LSRINLIVQGYFTIMIKYPLIGLLLPTDQLLPYGLLDIKDQLSEDGLLGD